MMVTIYYWPDGTWCYQDEYCELTYAFKGNDFGRLQVDESMTDDEITRRVDELVA